MITNSDSLYTRDLNKKYYVILNGSNNKLLDYYNKKSIKRVKINFSYNSETNFNFLTIPQIKKMIKNFEHY